MENNENQKDKNEVQPKKWGIKRILSTVKYVAIAVIIIGVLYLVINPEPLKNGKKLAKEGNHENAISEFSTGLDNYYNNDLPGGRRVRFIVSFGYKMNLHNFYYNMALSYNELAKIAEDKNNIENALLYYAYAIEAYDSTLLEKENHKKSIEAIAIVETEFEALYGMPYVMGTIFETDEEEPDTIKATGTTTLSEDKIKEITDQQIKTAQTFMDSGDYETAISQYDVGLHYAPNSIELYELKLLALYKLEDYDKTKECIKSILKLDKDNETAKKYQDMMI